MVLILEVPLASIALVLSIVSLKTIKAIKHIGVGRSFWIPILCSSIFFFAGSIVAVISDLDFASAINNAEIVSGFRLVGLCCLAGGVYTYSRKITKNLGEQLTFMAKNVEKEPEKEKEASTPLIELLAEKSTVETEVDCKHQLGYLRTLPRRAHIPEECLGCHQIIECKYSIVKKTKETRERPTSPDMKISDINLKEETTRLE